MKFEFSSRSPLGICLDKLVFVSSESFHHLIESLDSIDGGTKSLECKIKILSVLVLESHKTESSCYQSFLGIMILCENITKCVEIIRTFRHFLVIDEEMSPMQPVFGKCLSSIGLSLSNFILMVRKNQITSTHMDINLRAKELHITSRTLDVPSWTTF